MLTAKQEKFVQNIIAGMSQADAYRSAYSCKNMSNNAVYVNASKLMADTKITLRVQELREQMEDEAVMTAKERLKWLTGIIRSDKESTADKLRASDQMNKMQGEYVQKVEAEVKQEFTINVELVDE